MRGYNITKNLNAYAGRNNCSVRIGTTRNIKGSSNRIYQYYRRNSELPLFMMFPCHPCNPQPCSKSVPEINVLYGFFNYSFNYTGSDPLTVNLVLQYLPIVALPNIFLITPKVSIVGNFVNVYGMIGMLNAQDINDPNSATNQINYDALLNSWGTAPKINLLPNSIYLNAGNARYSAAGQAARATLTKTIALGGKGWLILDAGIFP